MDEEKDNLKELLKEVEERWLFYLRRVVNEEIKRRINEEKEK